MRNKSRTGHDVGSRRDVEGAEGCGGGVEEVEGDQNGCPETASGARRIDTFQAFEAFQA